MVQVQVTDTTGKATGQIEVPAPAALSAQDLQVVARAIERTRANARRPWAHTKTRSEISGGGRKPWRQKGTGRARVGSTRSPLWRHGGVTFGPRNDRNWVTGMNRKERRRAIRVALQDHALSGSLTVLEALALPSGKTKDAAKILASLEASAQRVLLVVPDGDDSALVTRGFRNLATVEVLPVARINALNITSAERVIVTRAALDTIQALWFK